ncbi:TonB-dependent receptor [Sphingomonas sp. HF-S4]|uniref:TonB-dependent receptor n=1 Tax=Sphingomonas agrestis TaxID=3080540 RepID=A0ABU3Y6V8_9SPHN|nr:TonB-dependent receptor [Sphingomonas sp. HF-S4]MDV3457135.1 TonB-dependent receptor [Sphingomonas sp. HF-S4]
MRIRALLVGTASAVALLSGAAHAQTADETTAVEAQAGEDIVVTGYRASLQASIDAKRQSEVIADIISAEDIGKFPDKNVAEALQRVPGIVINREFGEGERVSLRGTAPNLTKTLVNGHGIATADWFILDQLAATRSFNYLTLPAEIVGQLDVYKSPQADVEEGGIGGTINVHTRHPLDLPNWSLNASVQAVYSERSDKFDPQASGLVSWKNEAETFGVLLGGVYQKRRIRRDGVEVLGYQPVTVGGQTAQVPSLIGSALFQQERERYGGNIELQFKPSDDLEIIATGLYSRFNASNFNQNYLAWTANALGGGGTLTNATVTDATVVKGTVTSTPGGRAVVYDAIYRDAFAETYSGDLDLTWRTGGDGKLHLKAGYTRARGKTQDQPFYEGGAPGAFTFDITGRVPQVSFTGVDPTVPNNLVFDFASLHQVGNSDKEKYVYADFEQPVGGPISSIKIGGKYTDHDRNAYFYATTYGSFFVPLAGTGCGGRACLSSDFAGGSLPDDFLDNIALPGTLTNYFNVDTGKLAQILGSQPAANRARVLNPPENYSINEKTYGGYVMVKVGEPQVQGLHANIGLRVIRTEQTSRGNQLGVPAGTPGAVDNPFGTFAPIEVRRNYTDFLPAVNVWFDLSPQMILRFGAGRSIARPDYTDIVPRVSLNPGTLTGDGGDPSVNRYESDDYNLSLEWYPDRETIFAGALYYKNIASYIVNRTTQETFPVQTTTPNLSRCSVVNAGQQLYSCLFDINRRSNGAGGRNFGVELQASRRLFGPFGAMVNYTYSDAKSDSGDPIPGNSKHALNLTGYFENDWLSLRASYNYRSEFFINIDRASPLNQGSTESLDASLNVKLTDFLSLTADAVNLTNNKIYQYSGTETRFRALYDNGRIFYAGVRLKF